MKFENLQQFIDANMINRWKWLREAKTKDVATAMAFEDALKRLTSIEFEPVVSSGQVSEEPHKSRRLHEMFWLGKLGELSLGEPQPAYRAEGHEIAGHPVIPAIFSNIKKLVPDSDWCWSPLGHFGLSFTSKSFFFFWTYYDPAIGFTKIRIGYDDIDAEVIEPKKTTIEKFEEIINYGYEDMLNFWKKDCI